MSSQHPRSGLAFAAFDFSLSTAGSTLSTLTDATDTNSHNFAVGTTSCNNNNNPAAEEWPRRPSKFVQDTFQRNSGTSKDDMAMPSRHHRMMEPEFMNDSSNNNDNSKREPRTGRKKRAPQRNISQDDSNIGNYTHTPLKPRLRPSDRDIKKDWNQSSSSNTSLFLDSSDPKQQIVATTKNDLSHSLVAKLGNSAFDHHKNNIAAGRRRASVTVLPGSTHKDTGAAAMTVFAATAFGDNSNNNEKDDRSRSRTPLRKGAKRDTSLNARRNIRTTTTTTKEEHRVKFDDDPPEQEEPPKSQHTRHVRHHGRTEETRVVREHHHAEREESRHQRHHAEPSGHRRPVEQSKHSRHRRDSRSPPEQSKHTRHLRETGPEQSRHTRHLRETGPEQSRHTRHLRETGPEQSRHTRHLRETGPEQSRHTRHRRDSRSPQDATGHRRTHHRSDSPSPPGHAERSGHYRPSRRRSHSQGSKDDRQGSNRHIGHSHDRRRRHSAEGYSSHHRRRGGRSEHHRRRPEEEEIDRDVAPDDKVIRRKGADVDRSVEEKMLAAGKMGSEASLQRRKRESLVIPLDVLQKVPPQKARGRESLAIPLDVLQKLQNKNATPPTHDKKDSKDKEKSRHKRQPGAHKADDPSGRHGHRSTSKSRHKRDATHKGKRRSTSENTDHVRTVDLGHEAKRAPRRSSSLNQLDTDQGLDSRLNESLSELGVQRTTKDERHAQSRNETKGEGKQNSKVSDVFVSIGDTSKVGLTEVTTSSITSKEFSAEKDDRGARSRSPRRMPPNLDSVERTAHKLTMDTGRRRSISPRRQTISPLGFKGLAHQDSGPSRFKEALLQHQGSQEELVKTQPAQRKSSTGIKKLEAKSRRSLFVKSNSDRDVMVEGKPQYLSRSRMGFLDEGTSFSSSDSEEESDDEDVANGDERNEDSRNVNAEKLSQEDAVKSVKKKMRDSYLRMSRSEGDLLQTFDLEKEISREKKKKQRENRKKGDGKSAHKRKGVPTKGRKRGSTEHKRDSASRHDHRLTNDLDHVDLTALRPSQVQAVLKRAMEEKHH